MLRSLRKVFSCLIHTMLILLIFLFLLLLSSHEIPLNRWVLRAGHCRLALRIDLAHLDYIVLLQILLLLVVVLIHVFELVSRDRVFLLRDLNTLVRAHS